MAIYHLSVKIVSRGKGQSAAAKAAYNSRTLLVNENTGERHDYRRQGGVLFCGIFAPRGSPEWARDRQALWSAVEKREKRKNSQLAREVEIALPHELTDEQRENLVKDFVRENFVRKGLIADVAIHAPGEGGDERNYHAHILLTMREVGADGFGGKLRELNSKEQLEEWRERWARIANRYLERFGAGERIDHRSFAAQGIDREPTVHMGPWATRLEREGLRSERGDINREIEESNRLRERLKAEREEIEKEIMRLSGAAERGREPRFGEERERLEAARIVPEEAAERATRGRQAAEIERDAEKALTRIGPRLLSGAAKALDGLLDFFVGAPPETPEQKRARAEERVERAREAAKKEEAAVPKTAEELEKELFETRFKSKEKFEDYREPYFERERER